MSDCDEGDVPYVKKSCHCGLVEQEGVTTCPLCGRAWPENLLERSPYDGKPEMFRLTYVLVMQQGGGCDYTIACGTKVVNLAADNDDEAVEAAEQVMDDHGGFGDYECRVDSARILKVVGSVPFDVKAIRAERKAEAEKEAAAEKEAEERAEFERLKGKFGG